MPERNDPEASRLAWVKALAVLEVAVREVDRALTDPADPAPAVPAWTAPAGLGPLPEDLAAHAAAVLEAHREALALLAAAKEAAGRHLQAVRSIPAARDTGRSVYLDVTG